MNVNPTRKLLVWGLAVVLGMMFTTGCSALKRRDGATAEGANGTSDGHFKGYLPGF